MIQLNDIEQHSIDVSFIIDIQKQDKSGGLFRLKCIYQNGIRQTFYYKGKDALHADYQKLLIISALNNQISKLNGEDAR
jgi:hypothetical protein